MVTCSLLSMGVAATRLLPTHRVRSRQHLIKIVVLAAVFCVTVVLGNISLRFIPVSFNQAIGATTPAFTAVLHTLMTGEIESRGVYATLAPIVAGIVIASGAEPMFNLVGFLAAFSAVAGRALKSVLQAVMLADPADRMDSMSLLLYMAPIAAALLLPVVLFFEIGALQAAVVLGADGHFWGLLLLNCLLAYFANLTNFLVTKHTSALTLQVGHWDGGMEGIREGGCTLVADLKRVRAWMTRMKTRERRVPTFIDAPSSPLTHPPRRCWAMPRASLRSWCRCSTSRTPSTSTPRWATA